jgi:hypothetical protein
MTCITTISAVALCPNHHVDAAESGTAGGFRRLSSQASFRAAVSKSFEGATVLKTYEGGCHCGRVRFRIRADLEKSTVGECNCSICTKKGILHIAVTPEQLEILSGADDLTAYQFNTRVAKHTFCRHCGMHPFYVPRSDPENYSVNARCLDDYDPVEMRPRRFFDGHNWETAFAQREAERASNT